MAIISRLFPRLATPDRPRGRHIDDLVLALLSAGMVVGVFVDGWAHNNLDRVETFFTPWHALLYLGFAATAWWTARVSARNRWELGAVRPAYRLGVAGAAVFLIGGVADMGWHVVFGIEVDLELLLSPTHLFLMIGGLLLVSTSFRAGRDEPDLDQPSFAELFPALLSLTLATAIVAFFFQYASPFLDDAPTKGFRSFIANLPASDPRIQLSDYEFYRQVTGVLGIQITNLIYLGAIVLLLGRWRPPAGSLTFLLTTVAVLLSSQHEFNSFLLVLGPAAGGVAGDALVSRLEAGPSHRGAIRALAILVPLVTWSVFFLVMHVDKGVAWPVELWSGSIAFAVLTGFALSLLVAGSPARAERQ
jgi:hypothetical protein